MHQTFQTFLTSFPSKSSNVGRILTVFRGSPLRYIFFIAFQQSYKKVKFSVTSVCLFIGGRDSAQGLGPYLYITYITLPRLIYVQTWLNWTSMYRDLLLHSHTHSNCRKAGSWHSTEVHPSLYFSTNICAHGLLFIMSVLIRETKRTNSDNVWLCFFTGGCEYNGQYYGVGEEFEGTCSPGWCEFDTNCNKICVCSRDILDLLLD